MVFAQPDAFLVLGELEKVIVPRKPLFRDEGHFTVGQHKLLRIREDMVTQLAKWNFERAETGGGAHIKRSEEHTSELQSLMRSSYAVFCLKKNNKQNNTSISNITTKPI